MRFKINDSKTFALIILLGAGFILVSDTVGTASALTIPDWLKTTAKYWSDNSISNEEFVNVIQWLIDEEIIILPQQEGYLPVEGEEEDTAPGFFSSTRCELGYQYVKMTGRYTNGDEAYSVVSLKMAVLDTEGEVLATGSGLLTNVEARTTKYFDALAVYSGEEFDSCSVEVSSALPKERLLDQTAKPVIIEIMSERPEDTSEQKSIDELLNEMKEENAQKSSEIISEETITETESTSESSSSSGVSIKQIQSGLVISDPLNDKKLDRVQYEQSSDFWILGGSAQNLEAPYDYFLDEEGIHIGVQAPELGTYVGSTSLVPPTEGTLFHTTITAPQKTIPDGYLNNGLVVQGSDWAPNYITCVAVTNPDGTSWSVTYSYVDSDGNSQYDILFEDYNPDAPQTRDCTIYTDGGNLLRVFLDDQEVYSSKAMGMNLQTPLISSLSVQSSYDGKKLYGIFKDYYITIDTNIQVNNLPPSVESIVLLDSSNTEIASGNVENGIAVVDIGKFSYPLEATIRAMDADGPLASTTGPIPIYGGDIYEVDYG